MGDSETSLVDGAVQGDLDALSTLLNDHGPRLAEQLAPQIQPHLRGALDIEDVMQITYLEAFLRIGTFDNKGPGVFASWLYRIALNNLRDAVRELERGKRPPPGRRIAATGGHSESGAAGLLDRVGWTSTTPSRAVSTKEQTDAVLAALGRLPPDYARVLMLYELDGQSPEAVAEAMGRSVGAMYMLRARAIDRLRDVLSGM